MMEGSVLWIDSVNNELKQKGRDEPEKAEPEVITNSPGASAMLKKSISTRGRVELLGEKVRCEQGSRGHRQTSFG